MSEAMQLPSEAKSMRPRISYAEFLEQRWMEAFEQVRQAGKGAKYQLYGIEVELDFILDDPHPPSVWLRWRDENGQVETGGMRKGNPLLLEMKPLNSPEAA